MDTMTAQATPFTPFQIEMLEMFSRIKTEEEMDDIRRLLGQYFAKRAEETIVKRANARAAIEAMRQQSEQNGDSEMTLEEINEEIRQTRKEG